MIDVRVDCESFLRNLKVVSVDLLKYSTVDLLAKVIDERRSAKYFIVWDRDYGQPRSNPEDLIERFPGLKFTKLPPALYYCQKSWHSSLMKAFLDNSNIIVDVNSIDAVAYSDLPFEEYILLTPAEATSVKNYLKMSRGYGNVILYDNKILNNS